MLSNCSLHEFDRVPLHALLALILGAIIVSCGCAANAAEFNVTEIAPGVFVHEGRIESMGSMDSMSPMAPMKMNAMAPMKPMSRHNLVGDFANTGFIVGDDCVAVIDTGGSPQAGAALRDAVKAHTDKPICYVINTDEHPERVFGNSAFVVEHPTFIVHKNYPEALGARMHTYLQNYSRMFGHKLSPDIVIPPDRTVADTATVNLGDRILKLTAMPTGHTNCDLIVFDEQTATLWTGDLLSVHHIPELDGSITGWLADIKRLRNIDAKRAVPGRGPTSVRWPQALKPEQAYLNNVAEGVRAVIRRGGTIEQAVNTVNHGARRHWRFFDEYSHRRNVTAAFAELEWE